MADPGHSFTFVVVVVLLHVFGGGGAVSPAVFVRIHPHVPHLIRLAVHQHHENLDMSWNARDVTNLIPAISSALLTVCVALGR